MQHRAPRAVPIVVSAGLAVGVFCGLLFGLGTGSTAAATELSQKTPADPPSKVANVPDEAPVTVPTAPTAPTPAPKAAVPVAPTTITLTVDITPASAASDAKIWIDGKSLTGTSVDVPIDRKSVRLSISSAGFRSIDKSVELDGADTTIKQEMARRATGSVSAAKGRPASGSAPAAQPTSSKPRGIIDL